MKVFELTSKRFHPIIVTRTRHHFLLRAIIDTVAPTTICTDNTTTLCLSLAHAQNRVLTTTMNELTINESSSKMKHNSIVLTDTMLT